MANVRNDLSGQGIEKDRPVRILHHKCFGNDKCGNFICFGHADVIFVRN